MDYYFSYWIYYICCLLSFIVSLTNTQNITAQNADLNVIHSRGDYWLGFNNAPHSLYHYIMHEAFELFDERSSVVSKIQSLPEWKSRQQFIKNTLNEIIGPFPDKTPLNAEVHKVIIKKNFSVENILFESQPGFYVTSSLYLPITENKLPVIIFCSGHSMDSYRSQAYQHIILNLVQKGFAVFAFDPIGQGERIEYFDPKSRGSIFGNATREHSYPGTQALISGLTLARFMVWDGIRAVDYLFSREEIDTSRIGITGPSGGGTQTALIAAIDERIYAAAPERYITNFKRLFQSIGPTDAEQSIYHAAYRGIDHADLLSVRAPKPSMIIATVNDYFNIQGARETAYEVSKIYNAYNVSENFEIVEDVAGHVSTLKNREAMYAFFQKHLKNPGIQTDQEIPLLAKSDIQVTGTGQVSTSLNGETVYSLNRLETKKCITKLSLSRRFPEEHTSEILKSAELISGFHKPTNFNHPVLTGRVVRESYVIDKYFVRGEGDYVLPYLLFVPNQSSGKAMIYLHPSGKAKESSLGGEIEFFVDKGITVLAPDLLGIGELGPGHFRGSAVFDSINLNIWYGSHMIGRSIVGIRSGDVAKLVGLLKSNNNIIEIFGFARQELSPVLLHAAAFDLNISRIALIEPLSSYHYITTNRFYDPKFIFGIAAGALKGYDLIDLAASLAPRKLLMVNNTDEIGHFIESDKVKEEYKFANKLYQIRNASDKLNILFSESDNNYEDFYLKWIR